MGKFRTELERVRQKESRLVLTIIYTKQQKAECKQKGYESIDKPLRQLLKDKLIVKVNTQYFYHAFKEQQVIYPSWIQGKEFNQGIVSTACKMILQILKNTDADKITIKQKLNSDGQSGTLQDYEVSALLDYLVIQQKIVQLKSSDDEITYSLSKSSPASQNVFDKQICLRCPLLGDICPAQMHIDQCEYIKEWLSF